MEGDEIKGLPYEQVEEAERRLSHVPTISSNGKRMAVWSDIREALFLWCVNPACSSMLLALKHMLGYPTNETAMHPCSQREQLMFMKQFIAVTPGTLLVDVSAIQSKRDLNLLYELVQLRHINSRNANIKTCNEMMIQSAPFYYNKMAPKDLMKKKYLPSIRRAATVEQVGKEEDTWSVLNKDGKMRFSRGNMRQTRRNQSLAEGAQMQANQQLCQMGSPVIECVLFSVQDPVASEALVPLSLLREMLPPACHGYLEWLGQLYLLGRCREEGVVSLSRCATEEALQLTRFLACYKGFDRPWSCISSCSLVVSWAEFIAGYEQRHDSVKLSSVMSDISVVMISCEDIRRAVPQFLTINSRHQQQNQSNSRSVVMTPLQNETKNKSSQRLSKYQNTAGFGQSEAADERKDEAQSTSESSNQEQKAWQIKKADPLHWKRRILEKNCSDSSNTSDIQQKTAVLDSGKEGRHHTHVEKVSKRKALPKTGFKEYKQGKGSKRTVNVIVTRSGVNIYEGYVNSEQDKKQNLKSAKRARKEHSSEKLKTIEVNASKKTIKDDSNNSADEQHISELVAKEVLGDTDTCTEQKEANVGCDKEIDIEQLRIPAEHKEICTRGVTGDAKMAFQEDVDVKSERQEVNEKINKEGVKSVTFSMTGIDISTAPKTKVNNEGSEQNHQAGTVRNQSLTSSSVLRRRKGYSSPFNPDRSILHISTAKLNDNFPSTLRVQNTDTLKSTSTGTDQQNATIQIPFESNSSVNQETTRDEYPPMIVTLTPKQLELTTPIVIQEKVHIPTEKLPYKAVRNQNEAYQNGVSTARRQSNSQPSSTISSSVADTTYHIVHGIPVLGMLSPQKEAPKTIASISVIFPGPFNPVQPRPVSVSSQIKLPDEIVNSLREQSNKSICSILGNADAKTLEKIHVEGKPIIKVRADNTNMSDFETERLLIWQERVGTSGHNHHRSGRISKSADIIHRKTRDYTYRPTSSVYSPMYYGSNDDPQGPSTKTAMHAFYSSSRCQSPIKTDGINLIQPEISAPAIVITPSKLKTVNKSEAYPKYGSSSSNTPDIYDAFARRQRSKLSFKTGSSPMKTKLVGHRVPKPVPVTKGQTSIADVQHKNEKEVQQRTPNYSTRYISSPDYQLQRAKVEELSHKGKTFHQKYNHVPSENLLNSPYTSPIQYYCVPTYPQRPVEYPSCMMCQNASADFVNGERHFDSEEMKRSASTNTCYSTQYQGISRCDTRPKVSNYEGNRDLQSSSNDSSTDEKKHMCLLEKVDTFADTYLAPKPSGSLESIDSLKSLMNLSFTTDTSGTLHRSKTCIEAACRTDYYPFKHSNDCRKSSEDVLQQPYLSDTFEEIETDSGEKIARINSKLYFSISGHNELFKVEGDVTIPANAHFYIQTNPGEFVQASSTHPEMNSETIENSVGSGNVFLNKLRKLKEHCDKSETEFRAFDNSKHDLIARDLEMQKNRKTNVSECYDDDIGHLNSKAEVSSPCKVDSKQTSDASPEHCKIYADQVPKELESCKHITPSPRKPKSEVPKHKKSFQEFVEENRAAKEKAAEEIRKKKFWASAHVQYLKKSESNSGNNYSKKEGKNEKKHVTKPVLKALKEILIDSQKQPTSSKHKPICNTAGSGRQRPKTSAGMKKRCTVQQQKTRPSSGPSQKKQRNEGKDTDQNIPKVLPIENNLKQKGTNKPSFSRYRVETNISRPKTSQPCDVNKRAKTSRITKSAKQSKEGTSRGRETNTCSDSNIVLSAMRRLSIDEGLGMSNKKVEARQRRLRSFVKAEIDKGVNKSPGAQESSRCPTESNQLTHPDRLQTDPSKTRQSFNTSQEHYGMYENICSNEDTYAAGNKTHINQDTTSVNMCEQIESVHENANQEVLEFKKAFITQCHPSYIMDDSESTIDYSIERTEGDLTSSRMTTAFTDSYKCDLNSNKNNGINIKNEVTCVKQNTIFVINDAKSGMTRVFQKNSYPVSVSPCIKTENAAELDCGEIPYTVYDTAETSQYPHISNTCPEECLKTADQSKDIPVKSEMTQVSPQLSYDQENSCTIISMENNVDTDGELCLKITRPDGSFVFLSKDDPSYSSLAKYYEEQQLEHLINSGMYQTENEIGYYIPRFAVVNLGTEDVTKDATGEISENEYISSGDFKEDNDEMTIINYEQYRDTSENCEHNSDTNLNPDIQSYSLNGEVDDFKECDLFAPPDVDSQNILATCEHEACMPYLNNPVLCSENEHNACLDVCHHIPFVELDIDESVAPEYYELEETVVDSDNDQSPSLATSSTRVSYHKIADCAGNSQNFHEMRMLSETTHKTDGVCSAESCIPSLRRKHTRLLNIEKDSTSFNTSINPETLIYDDESKFPNPFIALKTKSDEDAKSTNTLKELMKNSCNKTAENECVFPETKTPGVVIENHDSISKDSDTNKNVSEAQSETDQENNSPKSDGQDNNESAIRGESKPKAVDSYSDINSVTDSELNYEADDDFERDEDYIPYESDENIFQSGDDEDIGNIYDDVRKINESLGIPESKKKTKVNKKKAIEQLNINKQNVKERKKSNKKVKTRKKQPVRKRKILSKKIVTSECDNTMIASSLDEKTRTCDPDNDSDGSSVTERCREKLNSGDCTEDSLPDINTNLVGSPLTNYRQKQRRSKIRRRRRMLCEDLNDEKESHPNDEKAAEGFIKTQKIYFDIIKNSSLNMSASDSGQNDCEASSEVQAEVPSGIPLHGDRVITKAEADAEKALEGTGDLSDDREPDTIEDLSNSCTYQLVEDEDHINLGGVACFSNFALPFVYINGYKYVPLRDTLTLFQPGLCVPACTIPRSVLQKSRQIVKTFSTWDQVYKLELIKMKKGPPIMTGDTVLKLDSLLNTLPQLVTEIVELHRGTKLKRSKHCDIDSYKSFQMKW